MITKYGAELTSAYSQIFSVKNKGQKWQDTLNTQPLSTSVGIKLSGDIGKDIPIPRGIFNYIGSRLTVITYGGK